MPDKRKLEMTISLNALEHLGMNLYSNVPSVLSEIVANAWDADAKEVAIDLDKNAGRITIDDDDGIGMSRDEVIDRFLNVGFKRRIQLGPETPKGRAPTGRKGIGKPRPSPSQGWSKSTRLAMANVRPSAWTATSFESRSREALRKPMLPKS